MAALRAAALVAWATAWLDGSAASDDVLSAVRGDDAPHRVSGLDEPAEAPFSALLIRWRRTGARPRLVLPVPGDLRGLPASPALRAASLEAGEAACCGGVAVVPQVIDYAPSSAPTSVTWQAFAVDPVAAAASLDLGTARAELASAVREAAAALQAAGAAGGADAAEQARLVRASGRWLNLPPGYPPRAVALVAETERLQTLLDLVALDPVGAATDRFTMSARESALRPLARAVRQARLAAYNALAD